LSGHVRAGIGLLTRFSFPSTGHGAATASRTHVVEELSYTKKGA